VTDPTSTAGRGRRLAAALAARRRRAAGAGIVLVALAVLTLAYGALAPRGSAASTDPAVKEGQSLFSKYSCASCHGLNGEGGNRAPSLIGVGAAAVDFQMGTGRMPLQQHGPEAPRKRQEISESDIHKIAAYVASLAPGPAIPVFSDADWQRADTAYGGALFRTNCAQCHNFAGSGGALTYGKYAPSLSAATPTQIYEAMITGPENMPVFGDQQITPDQKMAIINYIRTIKKQADPGGLGLGRVGPVSETAVGVLLGLGLCVLATIWIGSRA
jgi:ubiquinol-cytochrome c reductase cytochrome c subunit